MSLVRIATNFNIDIELVSAPFYKRMIAWFIDLVLLVLYLILASRLLALWASSSRDDIDSRYDLHFTQLLVWLPFFTYHLVCEITMRGQTVGKKITGIRVISETGERASISQYVIRCLIRVSDYTLFLMIIMIPIAQASGNNIFIGLGLILLLLMTDIFLMNSRKQQRLGDILAHTIVIQTRQKARIEDTIFQEISDEYKPQFPEVMRLSDRDINSLKGILDSARKKHDYDLAEMASNKIRNHLHIETSLSPFDFLDILLKDYNYLSSH